MKKQSSSACLIMALILSFALVQAVMAQDTITIGASQPLTGPKVFVDEGIPLIAALKDLCRDNQCRRRHKRQEASICRGR